jgi:O-acetylserine/cysteine efflux transporter
MNSRTLALALAAPLCWGTTFTLAKPAVEHFPPLLMMLFAYGFVAIATLLTIRDMPKTPWHKSFTIAAAGVTVQGALLFWAIREVEATVANLVLQTQVPAAVFLGWLIIGEPLTARKLFGTAIALAGVAIIIGLPETRPPVLPVAMIVASGVIWALGQVLVRKWSEDSGILVLKANALYGVPQLIVATLLIENGQWQAIVTAGWKEWLNLAFVCIIGFYLAYVFWFTLLKRLPIDEAVPFVLLMTPVGIVTAVLFLGETMSIEQVAGALILMIGLAIINAVGSKRLPVQ